MNKTKRFKIEPYSFIMPSLIIFSLFLFYPFFKTLYLSLYKTDKMGQPKLFVGFENYTDLFSSPSFYNSLVVTFVFVAIVVLGSMAIASSSAAMIFKIILHPSVGIANKVLNSNINWLTDPKYALICVAVLTAWLNSGINFLYFSAGLSNIDESIYERASIDGANSIHQFFKLTLPGLSPILFYTFVVNIIQAFQAFGQVKILTQGGPGESTNLLVYSIYRDAFFNYRFGSAAAQSVILFAIIMILTLVMFKMEKKGVKY